MIELKKEIDFVENYISFERRRLSKKVKCFLYALAIAFILELPTDTFGQNQNSTQTHSNLQFGEILGRVTDDKGNPLDFATVKILDKGNIVASGKTDENGNFLIHSLKPGWYNLSVSFYGYYGEEWQGFSWRYELMINYLKTLMF